MQITLDADETYELSPILANQPTACPCCWRTCQAAMGDACLGIVHMKAAAQSSQTIRPFFKHGPFIPDDKVKERIAERQGIPADVLNQPSCNDFKAVGSLGKRSAVLDNMGLAGLICRHEFVLVVANLFTEENFAYYELMLQQLAEQYASDGRELVCFFLDIACQFKKYWDRYEISQAWLSSHQTLTCVTINIIRGTLQADMHAAVHA